MGLHSEFKEVENQAYQNMLVEELLRFVDRSNPQVKALAEALEIEVENNENCGGLGQK